MPSAEGALGMYADKVSTPPRIRETSPNKAAMRAYARHHTLRKILRKVAPIGDDGYAKLPRVAECRTRRRPTEDVVKVQTEWVTGKARYTNLVTCDSIQCPICAARRAEQEGRVMLRLMADAIDLGYTLQLWTFTLQHQWHQPLAATHDALMAAFKAFQQGRAWQDFQRTHELLPMVRRLEVTRGDNGWHPHLHIVVMGKFKSPVGGGDGIAAWVDARWGRCLTRVGATGVSGIRADVREGNSYAAEYVAKWHKLPSEDRWGAEDELTKASAKTRGGMTIFDLLDKVAETPHDKAGYEALITEYYTTMKGRRVFDGLSRLAAELGHDLETLRAEATETMNADAQIDPLESDIVEIDRELWGPIVRLGLRGLALEVIGNGGRAAQLEQLIALATPPPPPPHPPPE